uniref:Threonylcarbamoyl-AMP synthase n=1 Tax=Fervidicoccus fontis TaxID=683846 RepID=A0A7J3ZID3_9CREN
MTRVVRVDPFNPPEDRIRECALTLRQGGLVAFPTETVYGLGADAYNVRAVLRVFEVKKRPLDNPLIVHISSLDQLREIALDPPSHLVRLLEQMWPGPLTVVLEKTANVPREVTGGLETIAVRMPAHPVALLLIKSAGIPVAAPSANISGRPSPTTAEHVIEDLQGLIEIVIDGGETLFGIESTIVDFTRDPPVLLRPGPVPVEHIEKHLGKKIIVPEFARGLEESEVALSPGVKYRHYAPRTELFLVETRGELSLQRLVRAVRELASEVGKNRKVCIVSTLETQAQYRDLGARVLVLGSRKNMYQVAHNLFKTLRALDSLHVDVAIVEGFEERGLGLAVMNRLRKAASRIFKV